MSRRRAISSTVILARGIHGRPASFSDLAGIAAQGSHLNGIRLKVRAVSHGRVGSTPTTISALRSTRCLVGFR